MKFHMMSPRGSPGLVPAWVCAMATRAEDDYRRANSRARLWKPGKSMGSPLRRMLRGRKPAVQFDIVGEAATGARAGAGSRGGDQGGGRLAAGGAGTVSEPLIL